MMIIQKFATLRSSTLLVALGIVGMANAGGGTAAVAAGALYAKPDNAGWVGSLAAARNAKIRFDTNLKAGDNSLFADSGPPMDKFGKGGNNQVLGRAFANYLPRSITGGGSTAASNGGFGSTVNGSTAYANWTNTASGSGASYSSDSGTYDPWSYKNSELPTGPTTLSYQIGLDPGSGLDLDPGETGEIRLDTYYTLGNDPTRIRLLSILAKGTGGNPYDVEVILGPGTKAYMLTSTQFQSSNINDKVGNGYLWDEDSMEEELESLLETDFARGFYLGLRFGVNLPGGNPDDPAITLFTESNVHVAGPNAVPEPGTMAVLGLGAMALLRRKRARK